MFFKIFALNFLQIHEPTIEISIAFKPPIPKCRRSIKSETAMKDRYHVSDELWKRSKILDNKQQGHIQSQSMDLSENELSSDEDTDHESISEDSNMRERKVGFSPKSLAILSNNKSDISSMRKSRLRKSNHTLESTNSINDFKSWFGLFIVILLLLLYLLKNGSTENIGVRFTQDNLQSVLHKEIENVKTHFYNQEPDIWNDISSSINEVILRSPKVPSIILLFANESATMDCLASKIAGVSSIILGTDRPLLLNPKDFGNDLGEIIYTLNKLVPTRKAVIIRDILNINAEAIKALHNLCDRFNPLIREAVYIITMQTTNYESSQKKMAFVEKQIYHKLSKSIDEDILIALITRITEGVIISVQPELNLRYCE